MKEEPKYIRRGIWINGYSGGSGEISEMVDNTWMLSTDIEWIDDTSKMRNDKIDQILGKYQLKVNIEMKDSHVGQLQSFDNCEIIQQDWDKPNIDIDNQEAWFGWLRTKQPFYIEDYIEKHNVFNNIDILKNEGLGDYIYEIITENRENKINQVLTV